MRASISNDEQFTRRALELASKGIGLTSPNPHVGCVITTEDGTVVGEGFHTYEDKKHAEVLALEHAGARSRGATLYVNLEPCSHQGRTGPCADAVIAAGIRRVVCCMQDPNPVVAGQGFAKLRDAGIQVEIGQFEAEARQINQAFAKYIRHKIPLVTLKCAMTLDGKIAPRSEIGDSGKGEARTDWITGEAARAHVQQLRHQSDAILTGIGTVLADDPSLTDRSNLPRRRPLLRVILDSRLRLPLESRIVQSAREDVLVFAETAGSVRMDELEKRGVRIEQAPHSSERGFDLPLLLKRLGELEVTSVLLEGGSHLNTSALDNQIVDKVLLYIAPKIFGDGAVPFSSRLQKEVDLRDVQIHRFGNDFAVEALLKDPYKEPYSV